MTGALRCVAALVICAGFIGALLLASHIGQQWRCDRLLAAHSPSTTTYDCNSTGAR